MCEFTLYAMAYIDGKKSEQIFTSNNLYEMIGKAVVLYSMKYEVEIYMKEKNDDKSFMIYQHRQGKKEMGILNIERGFFNA